nr:EOG090X0E8U [Polyphemus pediculus]
MARNKITKFDDDVSYSSVDEDDEDDVEEEMDTEDDGSNEELQLPVLNSIMKKGKIDVGSSDKPEEAERLAIQQELSNLSFEELQKLKEKLGSKKFNQTVNGIKKEVKERDFTRANKNRPREISSKSRKIEKKVAIQVPKVFKNDPRFDSLCGEFQERKFNRNYEFIYKMKEEEIDKLKEELKEEPNPRRTEKIKYLIQRLENQLRAEKQRKEAEAKLYEERSAQIEALKEGKTPHFDSKFVKQDKMHKEKFENLKKDGKLDRYVAKKRKHNAQRDRKFMPVRKEY